MYRNIVHIALLFTTLCLIAGCASNLSGRYEQGYGVVVFPDERGSVIWDGPEQGLTWGSNIAEIGGGYAAATLKPGVYKLAAIYNSARRGTLGSGNKDLDYGDRLRGGRFAPEGFTGRLGLASVKRMPIKEERETFFNGPRGEAFSRTRIVDVSSEYKMTLPVDGPTVEIKAGDVLLLPSFRADLLLAERACTRRGVSAPTRSFSSFMYNSEDFEILEWYCPVDKLAISKIPARAAEVRAVADPKKLTPAMLERLEERDLDVRALFSGANIVTTEDSGKILHVFMGP